MLVFIKVVIFFPIVTDSGFWYLIYIELRYNRIGFSSISLLCLWLQWHLLAEDLLTEIAWVVRCPFQAKPFHVSHKDPAVRNWGSFLFQCGFNYLFEVTKRLPSLMASISHANESSPCSLGQESFCLTMLQILLTLRWSWVCQSFFLKHGGAMWLLWKLNLFPLLHARDLCIFWREGEKKLITLYLKKLIKEKWSICVLWAINVSFYVSELWLVTSSALLWQ